MILFVALISPAVPDAGVPTPKLLTCAFELVLNPPAGPVGPGGPAGPCGPVPPPAPGSPF